MGFILTALASIKGFIAKEEAAIMGVSQTAPANTMGVKAAEVHASAAVQKTTTAKVVAKPHIAAKPVKAEVHHPPPAKAKAAAPVKPKPAHKK